MSAIGFCATPVFIAASATAQGTTSIRRGSIASGASGVGSGTIVFDVVGNPNSASRSSSLTIAGQTVPVIQQVISSGTPMFGICLGHQMLGLAVGAKTMKMHQGHHGANHPVKDETTGKVEITSMNHGFAVDQATLPVGATQTHISLFDGSNCGIELKGKPVFSVQYHPEASPGPRDSHYLFKRFADLMRANKRA